MDNRQFWAEINAQLEELKLAQTADEVIAILKPDMCVSAGDAFFAGSGGDGTMRESLSEAGWRTVWSQASYYWVMRAPNGDMITYIEGDVFRGDKHA